MISVENVCKSFGGVAALQGCSMVIEPGAITGLIGPNGAGKTTLFNVIAGHLKADRGAVSFAGRDITGIAPHRLFDLGVVRTFQVPQIFARLSVRENLMVVRPGQLGENLLAAWLSAGRVRAEERANRRKVEEVLTFLGIGEMAAAPAGDLSGGQKKLLELGRTMMTDAKMVLLDEPGAGVNRTLLKQLSAAIRTLNRDHGYTFCIIEHDLDLVAELCDPVVVMSHGRVLTTGTMAQVRADPAVMEAYFGTAGTAA